MFSCSKEGVCEHCCSHFSLKKHKESVLFHEKSYGCVNSTGVDPALGVVSVFLFVSFVVSSAFSASCLFLSSAVLANLFSRFQKVFLFCFVFLKGKDAPRKQFSSDLSIQ